MVTRFDPPPLPAKNLSKAQLSSRDLERSRLELVQRERSNEVRFGIGRIRQIASASCGCRFGPDATRMLGLLLEELEGVPRLGSPPGTCKALDMVGLPLHDVRLAESVPLREAMDLIEMNGCLLGP